MVPKVENPVFILGAHKSGTSLLRGLLDGHPDLFVIPFETHIFQLGGFWVDYPPRREHPSNLRMEEIKARYRKFLVEMNNEFNSMADSDMRGRIDLDAFNEAFNERSESFRELVEEYFEAIHQSVNNQKLSSKIRVVEKSVEHAEYAQELKLLFPGSKFIHIVRNPYSNLVSFRRYLSRRGSGYPFLYKALSAMKGNYYYLYKNRFLFPNDYFVARYEDVLTESESTMRKIALFLSINFHPILLQPTSLGKPWPGNSSRGLSFSGIAAKNLNLWKDELTHLESFYVNRFFRFILEDFGYDMIEPTRHRYYPVRKESPKTYLLNRLIPYFL